MQNARPAITPLRPVPRDAAACIPPLRRPARPLPSEKPLRPFPPLSPPARSEPGRASQPRATSRATSRAPHAPHARRRLSLELHPRADVDPAGTA
jgi:hypothetical protein